MWDIYAVDGRFVIVSIMGLPILNADETDFRYFDTTEDALAHIEYMTQRLETLIDNLKKGSH